MFIKDHSLYPIFGAYKVPGWCYYKHYFKCGVINLDTCHLVGLKIQDHPMVKKEKPNVEGRAKPKGGRLQNLTSTQ